MSWRDVRTSPRKASWGDWARGLQQQRQTSPRPSCFRASWFSPKNQQIQNTKVDVKANKYEAAQEQCTSSAGDIFIVLLYQATSRFEQQVLSFRSDTSRICFHVASRIVRRDQHFHEVESVSGALDTQMEVILDTNYNIYIHIYISI